MTGHYKDVLDVYVYQIPLYDGGYELTYAFSYSEAPDDFEWPKNETGWTIRAAIKKYIEAHADEFKGLDWKITRANSYWRDLHSVGNSLGVVYEVWTKKGENK